MTSSVSAVSDSAHSLGKGFGSMVTNVEGALGVPHPEEMMREPSIEEEKEAKEKNANNSSSTGTYMYCSITLHLQAYTELDVVFVFLSVTHLLYYLE